MVKRSPDHKQRYAKMNQSFGVGSENYSGKKVPWSKKGYTSSNLVRSAKEEKR